MLDWNNTNTAYIYGVSIIENYRNRGLGTRHPDYTAHYLAKNSIEKTLATRFPVSRSL